MIAFSLLTAVVALLYQNWLGIACSAVFMMLMIIGLFARSAMTRSLFESSLTLMCLCSVFMTAGAIIEKLIYQPGNPELYRCQVLFYNANYFGTVMSIVIIVCIYKVLTEQGTRPMYYGIAAFNLISIYLCGSLFAWVEILVGVATLFYLFHRHQMLSAFLLVAATFCIVIYCTPTLLPRLQESHLTTEHRLDIWLLSLKAITDTPLFGRGFLTYYHIYQAYSGYPTTHAHNFILEPLLSFGVIGSGIGVVYFIQYFRKLLICHFTGGDSRVTVLISAVTVAAFVHGTTDVTLMWIQTGLLFVLLLGGLGIAERKLQGVPART